MRDKIRFIFPLFLKFLLKSFSLFTLNHKKFSQKAFIFCFCSVLFLFHFFFQHFSLLLSSLFSLFTFSFHLFVHLFLIFSPFFSIFSPFFLSFSISVLLFHFFFSISCFLIFFSSSPILWIFSCFTSLFSSPFVLDLIFLFILLYLFFPHLRTCFFARKKSKICVSIFLDEHISLFFEPSLLPCFISCFFPPCVVLIPCLFHILLIISASWYYFSWFSSVNLLLGLLEKIVVLFLDKSFKKYHWFSFCHYFWKKKDAFIEFHHFCFFNLFFHAWSSKTCCYSPLFSNSCLKNILVLLSYSLGFCSKKKHL